MAEHIRIAKSWDELNEWQLQEIAHLYLNTPIENFPEAYFQMILIVYQKSTSQADLYNFDKLRKNVPISELGKYTNFLKDKADYYSFPEIPGLFKPADALGNITVRHFSTIDTYFYLWNKERSVLNLKRLVASLYRIKKEFDDLDIAAVDEITRKLPVKQMEVIALAFLFTRQQISKTFPVVFPKPKEETEEKKLQPIFTKKDNQFIPFDKIIIGMSMDELQPLGKKQDVNQVRVYEFLSVLSESILYHRAKAKANERK
ncbi:hypothetical protein AB670_02566 [Chryseobacterium sp. MOF25P]|uniref:hypothetical protein n=1 Tax=unclassified Chryseobacterium TaxID=2593645 RepID=UPI000804A914|nr:MULTISPECIES: hypothetical protein [unclassified Chryseobacterium]OBW41115.1 hypothetical protein AB670_02566 [Chryseobacterium sp. MOF25P]OBW45755.1 hypothetical protein AB671_02163 [Chryseobacterium sp. BGARF1]